MGQVYMCIDLKSFYASVECVARGYDPFKVPLVVADPTRGGGAITLAISPALKEMGVKNRCRIFEIPKHIQFEIAMPRMRKYIEVSAQIYGIYLQYISPDGNRKPQITAIAVCGYYIRKKKKKCSVLLSACKGSTIHIQSISVGNDI